MQHNRGPRLVLRRPSECSEAGLIPGNAYRVGLVAYPRADLAADLFLRYGGYFTRRLPASVRLTECRPPEMMSHSLSTA